MEDIMFDPIQSAKEAGLRYVSDDEPGYYRVKRGKGFIYQDDSKKKISNKDVLLRIKELVIPPAWRDVWICKHENGHLQVTGRDARERKQYRYHEKWTTQRNTTKFYRMGLFAKKLPILKKRIEEDLKLTGLPREKVLAAVIKVMLLTQSRVGNSSYAEENETYGLTTILNDHAEIKGSKVHLSFRGKSGVDHDIDFQDQTLAKIIKRCQELPGEELFAYIDGEEVIDITSTHVNDYLRSITGEDFSAKDLRTWSGTCKALELLLKDCPQKKLSEKLFHKRHVSIIKETAASLRNTVSVCKKYYIHPTVFEADEELKLMTLYKKCVRSSKFMSREEKVLEILLRKKK